MKTKKQELEWKLCHAYFSILETSKNPLINIENICVVSKVSLEDAKKIIPENFVNDYFFLKILIAKLDNQVLEEFKIDIYNDTISSTYDKILECLTLRFEKFLEFKLALKTLSDTPENKLRIFFKLLQKNYSFMLDLLDLVEDKQDCGTKTIKALALNILFVKGIKVFFENENNSLDSTISYIDKNLKDLQEIGLFIGIIRS